MDALAGDIEIHLPPDDEQDPYVRVMGVGEGVRRASSLVRQELDPPNKVNMKMDVPWTHHSHIIGKGGNNIQSVVKKTGVSIHFPDSNKINEMRKSNQVSINNRGEDLQGLEEARQAIRSLTPLIFSFTISTSVQFVNAVDANMLILHVQNTYNVQIELRPLEDLSLVGSVRGSEWDVQRVKEATKCILQAYCSNLASQVPVQMAVEVSPQHHAFILGRNNYNLKRIMHQTNTKIIFPDWSDNSLSPLKKSTITICGAIDSVYQARQNIIGSLPLVLMFDLMPGHVVEMAEVAQMMQMLDVQIVLKTSRMDGRRPVVVKGPERKADNVYEAWRMLSKVDVVSPKANIPHSYHMPDPPRSLHTLNPDPGHWMGGGGGGEGSVGSSPISSRTSTPTPLHHVSSTSLWGGLPSTTTTTMPPATTTSTTPPPLSLLPPQLSRLPHLDHHHHHHHCSSAAAAAAAILLPFHNGTLPYNNLNNNNNNNNLNNKNNNMNDNSMMAKDSSSGGSINIDSLVKSMKGLEGTNGALSCGTSSNSDGSSLSSPSHSPRDTSPDQILATSSSPFPDHHHLHQSNHYNHHNQPQTLPTMNALSALLKDIDRRAPGCEKKHMERVAAQKMTTTLSDYSSKKVEAARAMKQDVGSTPRTPTSNWSGYGFSKSMPGFMIQQKLQEVKEARQNGLGGVCGLEELGETWPHPREGVHSGGGGGGGMTSLSSSSSSSSSTTTTTTASPAVNGLPFHNNLTQYGYSGEGLSCLTPRTNINLSTSNFMDCVLPRSCNNTNNNNTAASSTSLHSSSSSSSSPSSSSQGMDIISILTDLQLPQYIDVFVSQEVDLKMFLSLEDYELKELGITIFGHRKRILMAIKDLSSKASLFLSAAAAAAAATAGGGGGGSVLAGVDHHAILRDSSTWN